MGSNMNRRTSASFRDLLNDFQLADTYKLQFSFSTLWILPNGDGFSRSYIDRVLIRKIDNGIAKCPQFHKVDYMITSLPLVCRN